MSTISIGLGNCTPAPGSCAEPSRTEAQFNALAVAGGWTCNQPVACVGGVPVVAPDHTSFAARWQTPGTAVAVPPVTSAANYFDFPGGPFIGSQAVANNSCRRMNVVIDINGPEVNVNNSGLGAFSGSVKATADIAGSGFDITNGDDSAYYAFPANAMVGINPWTNGPRFVRQLNPTVTETYRTKPMYYMTVAPSNWMRSERWDSTVHATTI